MSESRPDQETAECTTDNSDKGFSCDYCGGTYASEASLKKHKREQHQDDLPVQCPTCDKRFENRCGMKIHHNQAHGESLAGEPVNCSYCGLEFRVDPQRHGSQDNYYCSSECMGKHREELYSGEGHPRWIDEKPTFECDVCGSVEETIPALVDTKRFCSSDCKAEWLSNRRGKDHPSWSRVECECVICGETVYRKPSHLEGQENVFCSQDCHREYQSRNQVGENHHNYQGGRETRYGPNWGRQRTKAIRRDNGECQRCGVHKSELDRSIHVHHITKRRKFVDENENYDHERGNRLDNLITLCPSCHLVVEQWGVGVDRPE